MDRFFGRICLLILGTLLAMATSAQAGDGIKPKDLKRSYGYSCSGTASGAPFAQIGQVTCDGKDTCAGIGILNLNGVAAVSNVVGHFTLGTNGVGFINYEVSVGGVVVAHLPIEFVVLDEGREIRGLPLVPDYAVICNLREQ